MIRFGKYELLTKIGQGGMAEIFLARNTEEGPSQKLVAVKRLMSSHSGNEEFRKMFVREGEISILLKHPNIIDVIEQGYIEEYPYICMEYFPSVGLNQISRLPLDRILFTTSDYLQIVKLMADALECLHSLQAPSGDRDFVHRDVSPHNILVGFFGEAKLIDFGITKAMVKAEDTKSNVLKGKFSYMSPEQIQGARLDRRSDVFSLGVVLWELLAGRRLFSGRTPAEVFEQVVSARIPKLEECNPYVPAKVSQVVATALQREITNRYDTAKDFAEELEVCIKTLNLKVSQQSISSKVRKTFPSQLNEAKELQKSYKDVGVIPLPASSSATRAEGAPGTPFSDSAKNKKSLLPQKQVVAILGFSLGVLLLFWISVEIRGFIRAGEIAAVQKRREQIYRLEKEKQQRLALELQRKEQAQTGFKRLMESQKRANQFLNAPTRSPAALSEPQAKLSVFANKDARIMVDGKLAGVSKIKQYSVPAKRNIQIKVYNSSGKLIGSRVKNLSPQTHQTLYFVTEAK